MFLDCLDCFERCFMGENHREHKRRFNPNRFLHRGSEHGTEIAEHDIEYRGKQPQGKPGGLKASQGAQEVIPLLSPLPRPGFGGEGVFRSARNDRFTTTAIPPLRERGFPREDSSG
ncbi:MAG: hypothetical protein A3K30_04435 [Deltaproteobacteria bacterium RBG_13_51_10]|nr:MAG: hypothetical protein A3K30_04435 [Deltaproteobacteria bacterium RBG_13_51_10]